MKFLVIASIVFAASVYILTASDSEVLLDETSSRGKIVSKASIQERKRATKARQEQQKAEQLLEQERRAQAKLAQEEARQAEKQRQAKQALARAKQDLARQFLVKVNKEKTRVQNKYSSIQNRIKSLSSEAVDKDYREKLKRQELSRERQKLGDAYVALKISKKTWQSKLDALEKKKNSLERYWKSEAASIQNRMTKLVRQRSALQQTAAELGLHLH